MGISERKSRHKEHLRAIILEAAKKLFLEEGYHATSIRRIAKEIEFSPTTIYLYYKDKSEIAHTLHLEGFKLLAEKLGVVRFIDDPFERIKLMGRLYIQFSIENTGYYEMMFVQKEPMDYISDSEEGKNCWDVGDQAFQILVGNVEACQAAGYLLNLDSKTLALNLWSTIHGLCTLSLHGHLDHIKAQRVEFQQIDNLIDATYSTYVQMLERIK